MDAVSSLLGFVNQVRSSTEAEPFSNPEERYDARTLRLVNLYLGLVDPLTRFVNGDALNAEDLDQVQSGLTTIEALATSLPESEF